VRLVQEANINAVLTEELFQVRLPAANTISVSTSQPQGFSPACPRPHRLGYEEDDGFEETARASFPYWQGGGRGEKAARQLGREILQKVSNPFDG
jgi:hypothetical protein